MNKQDSEKKTEIWLKYCEDCIKSKIEANECITDNSTAEASKKSTS